MRIALFAAVSLAACFSAATPGFAQDGAWWDPHWEALSPTERIIIDRVAADFYEESLRTQQSSNIEATTPRIYQGATAEERDRFRDQRRTEWRAMSPAERDALRGVTRPAFRNLAESQKAPFRSYAIDQLTASGAVDGEALRTAVPNEV